MNLVEKLGKQEISKKFSKQYRPGCEPKDYFEPPSYIQNTQYKAQTAMMFFIRIQMKRILIEYQYFHEQKGLLFR